MPDAVEEKAKQYMDVRVVVFTSIISALGFVLALFWNEAVKSAIEQVIPKGDTIAAKFIAAIIVTVAVVIIIYLLIKSQKITEKGLAELNRRGKNMKKQHKGSQPV